MTEKEKTYPCIEVYERSGAGAGTFAWRLRAGNQQIIATDGGQGYENKEAAVDMADRIVRKGEFANVDIWRPKN